MVPVMGVRIPLSQPLVLVPSRAFRPSLPKKTSGSCCRRYRRRFATSVSKTISIGPSRRGVALACRLVKESKCPLMRTLVPEQLKLYSSNTGVLLAQNPLGAARGYSRLQRYELRDALRSRVERLPTVARADAQRLLFAAVCPSSPRVGPCFGATRARTPRPNKN